MALKTVTLTVNGQTYTLTKNTATGKYEKSVTAPAKSSYTQPLKTYAMILKAEDMAGNVTTVDQTHAAHGPKMKLTVKEKVAPTITITSPGAGSYLTSHTVQITFDIADNDSGVNPDTISLKIDAGAAITSGTTKTAVANGYRCTYATTVLDGAHTIKVDANDFDGNAAVQKATTFTVDTVPPALNVASPAADLITNKQSCSVAGVTNDVTSPSCAVIVKLNNADQGPIVVNADGTFAKAVTLAKGANTIYVKSTDKAGKYSEVTLLVEYDPDAPVVASVTITPNPVDAGATFTITVDVTD